MNEYDMYNIIFYDKVDTDNYKLRYMVSYDFKELLELKLLTRLLPEHVDVRLLDSILLEFVIHSIFDLRDNSNLVPLTTTVINYIDMLLRNRNTSVEIDIDTVVVEQYLSNVYDLVYTTLNKFKVKGLCVNESDICGHIELENISINYEGMLGCIVTVGYYEEKGC